jgi:hypothetical protein
LAAAPSITNESSVIEIRIAPGTVRDIAIAMPVGIVTMPSGKHGIAMSASAVDRA